MTKTKPKKTSGTTMTYAQRAEGGRPNRTFTLPVATIAELEQLAAGLGLSKSEVIVMAVALLVRKNAKSPPAAKARGRERSKE